MAKLHEGDVVYGSDGAHYAVGDDGHIDQETPLTSHDEGFKHAVKSDTPHEEQHHENDVWLDLGGGTIDVAPDEIAAVEQFLANRRAGGAA